MGKLARDALKEESEFELPISMIDVVFLLLIFFIVTAKFKEIENRLDAYLPKDEGQNPIKSDIEKPDEVRVYMWVPENDPNGVYIGVNDREKPTVEDVNELADKLKSLKASIEHSGLQKMTVVLDARKNVMFDYVIGALDACYLAEIEEVKFQAPPIPDGGGDKWFYK